MTRGFPARVPSLGVSSMLADQLMLKQNHLLPLECLSRNICCQVSFLSVSGKLGSNETSAGSSYLKKIFNSRKGVLSAVPL